MMVSVETCLLRGKRQLEKYLEVPGVREAGSAALFAGGGILLSALQLRGTLQPAALALVVNAPGWRCIFAALGSAVGYRLFWEEAGLLGGLWALGAMVLTLVLPLLVQESQLRSRMSAGLACVVCTASMVFSLVQGSSPGPEVLVLRIAAAAGCGLFFRNRSRLALWVLAAASVMAAASLPLPLWANPGPAAVGLLCTAAPLPAAALAGLGFDLARPFGLPLAAVACLCAFLQLLPIRESRKRMAAPGCACLLLMLLRQQWEWALLPPVCVGAALGTLLPWHLTASGRRNGLGAVQVQLELAAGVLAGFSRQLLEYPPPGIDTGALAEQTRRSACGSCPRSSSCTEQQELTEALLTTDSLFVCPKAGLVMPALERSRDQLRRMKHLRSRQEEYRLALIQQYSFLSDTLRTLADRLPEPERRTATRFRVKLSARSHGRELAEGDRVCAFPGRRGSFYVILCDGMGTGLGAAEESRRAAALLRQMLCAGLPPVSALGGINSQLTLLGRAGAVTVDLAEIRLDSGRVWVYKWGSAPSWLLHRGHARQIGSAGPPPGLHITDFRENSSRISLTHGELLLLISDGIRTDHLTDWALRAETLEPGELAAKIVKDGSTTEDDATAVVIRLEKAV